MAKKKEVNVNEKDGKKKALEEAFGKITKSFGEGAIMKLGERKKLDIETISSGSLNLDEALGIGGFPKGRIVEIYGAESSGKTTIALHAIAESQKKGGTAAFIDAEHALDPIYAKAIGVNIDDLLISQPSSGEEALEIADLLITSGAVDIIVVDSVAALVPKSELEGEMSDQQMGLQARLMSKAIRKLTGSIFKHDCLLIFINQIREKIGGFSFTGPQTTTSGGRALKFAASVRVEIKKTSSVKQGDDIVGNEVLAKVIKNKLASPFKEAKFSIMYGQGISKENEILSMALEYKICTKSGSWFSFGDERLGQGQANAEAKMKEDKELTQRIYAEVIKHKEKLLKEKQDKLNKKVESEIKEIEKVNVEDTIDLGDIENE